MRSPARQLGRVSGAPTNAAFALIGAVENGTSFHASFQAFMHPLKDSSARKRIFWDLSLTLTLRRPTSLLRLFFPLTRRQKLIEFLREVSPQGEGSFRLASRDT